METEEISFVFRSGQITLRKNISGGILASVGLCGGGIRWLFTLFSLAPAIVGAALLLETSARNAEVEPIPVLAGHEAEMILTVSAATVLDAQLRADLFAEAGPSGAVLWTDKNLELHRIGQVQAGVQRFGFKLDVPAVKRKQALILRLRVQPSKAEGWLPLPSVKLAAEPLTWRESLQSFARIMPSGRQAGSERIRRIFEQAETEVSEIAFDSPVTDPALRVCFAESSAEELQLPEAPSSLTWIIFKKNVRHGVELRQVGVGARVVVVVDSKALAVTESDALAQQIFERALTMTRALTKVKINLSQP